MKANSLKTNTWPKLSFQELHDSIDTLQLWLQIVGKIRMSKMQWLNHSWHVTLYVSSRGLTTGAIPYAGGNFQIDFDFIAHQLVVSTSNGDIRNMQLYARTVASFHKELFSILKELQIAVEIYGKPNELDHTIPFAEDEVHKSYSKIQINNLFKALVRIEAVFNEFRSRFCGKCSPVHFFWGAFDLAVTRFSGREAPQHQGGAPNIPLEVMQEAYSHEVSSAGFWPGSKAFPYPSFYAYCYPSASNFGQQPVKPESAYFSEEMGEFLLPYDAIRKSNEPEKALLDFLQSTYDAAASTGNWDQASLTFKNTRNK